MLRYKSSVCPQVIDGRGNVAGVLNIAKCLWDAIHRLEKKARRTEEKERASTGGSNADLAASVLQVGQTRAQISGCWV